MYVGVRKSRKFGRRRKEEEGGEFSFVLIDKRSFSIVQESKVPFVSSTADVEVECGKSKHC